MRDELSRLRRVPTGVCLSQTQTAETSEDRAQRRERDEYLIYTNLGIQHKTTYGCSFRFLGFGVGLKRQSVSVSNKHTQGPTKTFS